MTPRLVLAFCVLELPRPALIDDMWRVQRENPVLGYSSQNVQPLDLSLPEDEASTPVPRGQEEAFRAPTLEEQLSWQVRMTNWSAAQKRFAELVIARLDQDGYLDLTVGAPVYAMRDHAPLSDRPPRTHEQGLAELAQEAGADPKDASRLLQSIQSLHPTGVASRDPQRAMSNRAQSFGFKKGDPELNLIEQGLISFADLDGSRPPSERGALHVSGPEALDFLRYLRVPPARRFTHCREPILPDVSLVGHGSDLVVIPNRAGFPNQVIDQSAVSSLLQNPATQESGAQALRRANEWLHVVDQRIRTIVRITECIVTEQREFFARGAAMKPLTLRHVAETVAMHEWTIVRVVTDKYVSSPRGMFELKTLLGNPPAG